MKYKVLSLFSGAGGLDKGLLMSRKYDVILANDVKPFMTETYSINFKMVKSRVINPSCLPQVVLNDVSVLDFDPLKDQDVDVVVGGPPCQDFSVLRSSTRERTGIKVRRGRLYAHFVRALVTLQPKAFLFENVPGLVTANDGQAYKTIIRDFSHSRLRWEEVKKSLGENRYDITKIQGYNIIFNEVVDSSDFGVPQARRRLFVVGLRRDLCKKRHLLSLSLQFKRHLWRYKRLRRYPLTCMEVFEGKAFPNLQDEFRKVMEDYDGVWKEVRTPKAFKWKEKVWDKLTFDVVEDYLWFNNIKRCTENELEEAIDEHEKVLKELKYKGVKVSELTTPNSSNIPPRENSEIIESVRMIPPGENFEFVKGSRWQIRKKGVSQIYRKLNPLKPSYTVVAFGGGGMAMYHYDRSRSALTNREKARLQTFPDSFLFRGKYSTVKAQIGEAVPPLLAKRLGEALAAVLNNI